MIRDHRPDLFLIQETKMKKEKVEKISFGKGLRNSATNSDGASGGLLTIWKDSLDANIIFDGDNILLINFFGPKNLER